MYALVDGNNFYVSCERVFRPSLVGRPVVVLSNNDGCAVARSDEAKALGIKMGQPWFQCKSFEASHSLVGLSANFALYGDLSDRMMAVAGSFAPRQEVYSIDESFLDFTGMQGELVPICRQVRARVLQWVGIPTCVGIGPTKTLAKLANHIAKSAERKPGSYPVELAQVCHLGAMNKPELDAILASTAVGEVWGVGRRIGAQLVEAGIKTVLDLERLDPMTVRRRFSVVLEKTVRELQGVECIGLVDAPQPKQQIMVSRSFGHAVTRGFDLATAVTEFTSRAAEKLRKQQGAAGAIVVFIRTSPFRADDLQYSGSITVPLVRPTADSTELVASALAGLRRIYRKGHRYAKAGVMLVDLQSQDVRQCEFDWGAEDDAVDKLGDGAGQQFVNSTGVTRDRTLLMSAVDELNRRFGRGALHLASTGLDGERRPWSMKQERRTPRYTTHWDEIPIVRA